MPRKWSEVAADPVFQKLSPDQQEGARQQYFNDVVSPQVPAEQLNLVKEQFDRDTKDKYLQTNDEMSGLQKFGAGVGAGMYGAYLGVKEIAAKGLNKVGAVSDETVNSIGSDVNDFKEAQAGINRTGAGMIGNVVGNAAALAPALFIPGANTYAGAALVGGVGGAVTTPGDLGERATAGAFGAAGGVAGKYVGGKIGEIVENRATAKASQIAAEKMQNAPRDAVLATSREAGYVVPPTQTNPTVTNRALEGFAGKLTTAQNASAKNQNVTNQLAKKALGLPEDAPITVEVIESLRKTAGEAYGAVAKIEKPFIANQSYKKAVKSIGNEWAEASKEFPDLVKNTQIETLIENLNKNQISPSAAVEVVKKLRFDSKANLKAAEDPAKLALGKAQSKAASIVEDLIEDNLQSAKWRFDLIKEARKSGSPYEDTKNLLKNLKEARQLIAKSYDVEAALNETTGNVSAKHLAKLVEKGKPLTGELRTAGEFARTFPKAAQNLEGMGSLPGLSPLDFAAAGISGAASGGNPLSLAALAARPATRTAILSEPFQNRMIIPSYEQGRLNSILPLAINNDKSQGLLRLLATGSGAGYAVKE